MAMTARSRGLKCANDGAPRAMNAAVEEGDPLAATEAGSNANILSPEVG
jgi:hypothetical protein